MTMAYCVVSVAVLTRWPWQGSIYLLYRWSAKPETGLWLPFEQHFSPFWPFWLFVPFFLLHQLTVLLCWNVLASLRAIVGNWQLAIVNWQFFQDSPNGRAVGHACHSTTEVLSSCFSFILLDKRFLLKLMKIDKKLSRLPASRFDNWISKSQVDMALNSINFSTVISLFL